MTSFMSVSQAKASVRQIEKICSIRPTAENLSKLAECYFILDEVVQALQLAQMAFSKDPNDPVTSMTLGLIQKDLGMHDEAHNAFKLAFEIREEDMYVRLAYSESLLRRGMWKAAWPIYETARSTKEAAALAAGIGLDIKMLGVGFDVERFVKNDSRLLILEEGGIGDRITFSRYLPVLTKLGVKWRIFPRPELKGFFERASWCGSSRVIKEGDSIKETHWTTLFSLPANLYVESTNVPDFTEPFKTNHEFISKYKLKNKKKPSLGLCWYGEESLHGGRKVHSLTEGQAMKIVCKTEHLVDWVNLQYDYKMPRPVENVKFSTWEELAGLIHNLDIIFSVETGTMCLSCAMGKPTVIMLSTNSDWRFLESGDSPFYKTNVETLRNGDGGGLENTVDKTIDLVLKEFTEENSKIILTG